MTVTSLGTERLQVDVWFSTYKVSPAGKRILKVRAAAGTRLPVPPSGTGPWEKVSTEVVFTFIPTILWTY